MRRVRSSSLALLCCRDQRSWLRRVPRLRMCLWSRSLAAASDIQLRSALTPRTRSKTSSSLLLSCAATNRAFRLVSDGLWQESRHHDSPLVTFRQREGRRHSRLASRRACCFSADPKFQRRPLHGKILHFTRQSWDPGVLNRKAGGSPPCQSWADWPGSCAQTCGTAALACS